MSAGPLSLSAILQVFHWGHDARISRRFDFVWGRISGSKTVVTKKKVYFTDSLRFDGHDPVGRGGKATGRRAFEMQSAQSVSAAYYFNPAARDCTLTAGAIELVVEGVPCPAFIEPSQSCELIFCARLDRLRGRKHAGDAGKFRRDLQEQSRRATRHSCFNTRYLMVGD
jgi:hypothetical protein